MLGLLPGFGHLGRPPEESKGVSVAPARHPCQLLTSVPEPTPTLDRDPHSPSTAGALAAVGAGDLPLLSLFLLSAFAQSQQVKETGGRKCVTHMGSKHNTTDFILFWALLKREKENEVMCPADWRCVGPRGLNRPCSQLVGCEDKGLGRGMES